MDQAACLPSVGTHQADAVNRASAGHAVCAVAYSPSLRRKGSYRNYPECHPIAPCVQSRLAIESQSAGWTATMRKASTRARESAPDLWPRQKHWDTNWTSWVAVFPLLDANSYAMPEVSRARVQRLDYGAGDQSPTGTSFGPTRPHWHSSRPSCRSPTRYHNTTSSASVDSPLM